MSFIGQEVIIALSKSKQTAIGTLPATDSEYINFGWTDRSPVIPTYETESDSEETGNGHEFPNTNFPVAAGLNKTLSAVASSELMAFIAAHQGKVVKARAFTYTGTFHDRAADGDDASTFGLVQKLGAYDPGFAGNAIASWGLSLQRGASRSAATVTMNVLGTGNETNPSTITIPAKLSQKDLLSASLELTAVGNDYVTPATINSLEFNVDNGLDAEDMFFPGSGVDANGFAIGGRLRYGIRTLSLSINAEFVSEVAEIDKLKAQTEGAVTIKLINDLGIEDVLLTMPRAVFAGLTFSEGPQNRVTIDGDIRILQPPAAEILTILAITAVDGFGDDAV